MLKIWQAEKKPNELLFFHKNNKFPDIPREINSSITRKARRTQKGERTKTTIDA